MGRTAGQRVLKKAAQKYGDEGHVKEMKINTYLLIPWSRVLENLNGFQLVKKFPAFYETRRFITASQVPATCHYPEPARSSPYPHIPHPEDIS